MATKRIAELFEMLDLSSEDQRASYLYEAKRRSHRQTEVTFVAAESSSSQEEPEFAELERDPQRDQRCG